MNNVRGVAQINEKELALAVEGGRGSWHEDYRDSAYVFVGNLDKRLTEGDVIAVFSQYGEVLDINLPRVPEGGLRSQSGGGGGGAADVQGDVRLSNDKERQTAKPGERRGFGFLLYEDQRSTVLAVDNLNGFVLLNRTLRVDHVRDYKMPKRKNEEGEWEERQEPSRNAAPVLEKEEEDDDDDDKEDDAEDPMAAYIARSRKSDDAQDKEERRRRKEERKRKREEKERRREESHAHHRSRREGDKRRE